MRFLLLDDLGGTAKALRRRLQAAGIDHDVHALPRAMSPLGGPCPMPDPEHLVGASLQHLLQEAAPHDVVLVAWSSVLRGALDACTTLLAAGLTKPLLVLTPLLSAAHRVAALDAGADDCCSARVAPDELLARARALARRSAGAIERRSTAGRIAIDWTYRTAFLDGVRLSLTSRELDLLGYFVRRAGEVVSRAELLANVWGDAADPGASNTVTVYVRHLRAKLGSAATDLTTVRSGGYLLRARSPDPSVEAPPRSRLVRRPAKTGLVARSVRA
jgi:DNA-binding response OmpR family regulator